MDSTQRPIEPSAPRPDPTRGGGLDASARAPASAAQNAPADRGLGEAVGSESGHPRVREGSTGGSSRDGRVLDRPPSRIDAVYRYVIQSDKQEGVSAYEVAMALRPPDIADGKPWKDFYTAVTTALKRLAARGAVVMAKPVGPGRGHRTFLDTGRLDARSRNRAEDNPARSAIRAKPSEVPAGKPAAWGEEATSTPRVGAAESRPNRDLNGENQALAKESPAADATHEVLSRRIEEQAAEIKRMGDAIAMLEHNKDLHAGILFADHHVELSKQLRVELELQLERLNAQRRYLKTHAVPTLFPALERSQRRYAVRQLDREIKKVTKQLEKLLPEQAELSGSHKHFMKIMRDQLQGREAS